MPKVVLSEQARTELTAIWDHLASHNMDAADRFLTSAETTFHQLAAMTGMGHAKSFRQPRLNGLRCFQVNDFRNYLVFYFPMPDGIQVLRILHRARDLDSLFSKDEH